MAYDHKEIESKWQGAWDKAANFSQDFSDKPKKYILVEFPYPSGAGLHMGHLRSYVAADVISRFLRAGGSNVMFPIGWDAFGLPAENYAIKMGVKPQASIAENIGNFRKQLDALGLSFDWSREVNTTDPDYYKWTQWIFLQFFKAGLAYEATGFINWCPKDKTGLANEEVIDGRCERCGTLVEKKELRQWYLKITAYADKLLDGLKDLDWPDAVKLQQQNWIGKSEGAEIDFKLVFKKNPGDNSWVDKDGNPAHISVFTTRPDTIFGATYLVLAPEHPWVRLATDADHDALLNRKKVLDFIESVRNKPEMERIAQDREKSGVELEGVTAINPATGKEISVWIADYVLANYGTGAVMAVPAHDERDFSFAKKYNLGIIKVIKPDHEIDECYSGEGMLIDSGEFTSISSSTAKSEMAAKFGRVKVFYKLRDWVFSRQRYWGEPIPLIHCKQCGIVPVPDNQLPVKLPDVDKYEPTGTGESPLASIADWVNIKCPKCGGEAKRETNTMPQWAGSSWYWLRYTDPKDAEQFAAKKNQEYWTPVDTYFGGMEHTTLHLLYARFWNRFLFDQGFVSAPEPFLRRIPHGIVLASDGEKMSKSRGNVVNPDDLISKFGADATRMYEMFLGPHELSVSWNERGIVGVKRFLDKIYRFGESGEFGADNAKIHKLVQKITSDIEHIKFNTAVAAFMEFFNDFGTMSRADWEKFLKLLSPFAPYITEELWHMLGHTDSVHTQPWPQYDESLIKDETVEIVISVNGKKRGTIRLPAGLEGNDLKQAVDSSELYAKLGLKDKKKEKIITVPDKLVNFVIKE
ncbi:MAG TPA: leucine--tRNA ligase [Patescibacteria group bacterium]|nr:leucine--tRNA ligase [Patescibacteria group bacterium]